MDNQETQPAEQSSSSDAVLLVRIEEMIKTHNQQIDDLQEEIKKHKEMLDDIFANDETYQEHDKAAKETAKIRSATRQQILKRPDAANLSNKLKEFKTEQKDLKTGLSDYLREYQRLSGSNMIESDEGEVQEIVFTAKLVKRSSKF